MIHLAFSDMKKDIRMVMHFAALLVFVNNITAPIRLSIELKQQILVINVRGHSNHEPKMA